MCVAVYSKMIWLFFIVLFFIWRRLTHFVVVFTMFLCVFWTLLVIENIILVPFVMWLYKYFHDLTIELLTEVLFLSVRVWSVCVVSEDNLSPNFTQIQNELNSRRNCRQKLSDNDRFIVKSSIHSNQFKRNLFTIILKPYVEESTIARVKKHKSVFGTFEIHLGPKNAIH